MTYRCLLISILVASTACSTHKTVNNVVASKLISETQSSQKIPGIGVTVIKNGKVLYNKGTGVSNLSLQNPVDPNETLFRVASISKSLTSALFARLDLNDMVELDSSIYTYSTFPKKTYDFTLRQLAGHTAGIRTYKKGEFLSNIDYQTVESAISIFKDDSLQFKPGSQYLYSTYGWNLMSRISEEITGKPYLQLMQDSVFSLMHMSHTFPNDLFEVSRDQNRTGYYKLDNGKVIEESFVNLSNKWAGGGFESTSYDIAQFAQSFWFSDYISKEIRTDYTTSNKLNNGELTNYGIAWVSKTDEQGEQWYGHVGSAIGGKSIMMVYPKHALVIVILTNATNANIQPLYKALAKYYLKTDS